MAKKRRKSGRVSVVEAGGQPISSPSGDDDVKNKTTKKHKCEQNIQSLSLAQLLKKQRGTAADTPAPPVWRDTLCRAFLTPNDDQFDDCLRTSFKGFYFDTPSSLPLEFHRAFHGCFDGLEKGGLFLYDVVQPGRKKLTLTSVTRTLVGDPGSTYKYLGLRLFSHPWIDVDSDGDALHVDKPTQVGSSLERLGYSSRTAAALIAMGQLNKQLTDRSRKKLRQHETTKPVGSADFNLTLVNKMDPVSVKRDLKRESAYNMGRTSVGWHRDSGLKDFSTIAVYQLLHEHPLFSSSNNSSQPWGVALRACDGGAGGPLSTVPALKVPLPSGSLYYMLDDFNHNHEHAVIAGDSRVRYSSTHRVAREGQGTWQYIRDKARHFLSSAPLIDWSVGKVNDPTLSPKQRKEKLVSRLRSQEALLSEIEFEWLRQWFVQGQKHALLHPYWHSPIKTLVNYFGELEQMTIKIINLMKEVSERGATRKDCDMCETLFDVLIESFTERNNKRKEWARRYKDPIFRDLAKNERPFTCQCLDRNAEFLSADLDLSISQLREWRSAFANALEQPEYVKIKRERKNRGKKTRIKLECT
jgi:alpha-ketoglutarate-dependent dioxygenase FTO